MQLELSLYKQTVKPGEGFGKADGGRGVCKKTVSAVCLFVQPVCRLMPIYSPLVKRLLIKNEFNAKVDADFGWTFPCLGILSLTIVFF